MSSQIVKNSGIHHQRSLKVTKGQFMHLVKFVYKKFTYIPNFIPNSKKLRKASPKVTKGHQRSIGVFSKHCIHKIMGYNKFHRN